MSIESTSVQAQNSMRCALRLPVACALAAHAASPVAAAELPRFDTPAHCKVIAVALGPYSERIYQGCLRIEQAARAQAQALWPVTDPETRATCATVAAVDGPGSYKVLAICLSTDVGSAAPSRGT